MVNANVCQRRALVFRHFLFGSAYFRAAHSRASAVQPYRFLLFRDKLAKRIRARATRRAGELLKQVEPAQGARSDLGPVPSRSLAAQASGMSERQAKTAQRLANVPEEVFEEMVESNSTITAIAEIGTGVSTGADAEPVEPSRPRHLATISL